MEMTGDGHQESEHSSQNKILDACPEEAGRPGALGATREQEKEKEKTGSEIAGDGGERIEDEEFLHEVSDSLWLTIISLAVLVSCGLRGGEADWIHYTVFGLGYLILFGVFCLGEKFEAPEPARSAEWSAVWTGSRFTICLVGFAAFSFGSPVLLEISPDMIAVVGALGGSIDGSGVGELAKRRGCSTGTAVIAALSDRGGRAERPS